MDREGYIRKYVEGIEEAPSPQMVLGKIVHAALEDPTDRWIEELKKHDLEHKKLVVRKLLTKIHSKRPPEAEITMTAETPSGIRLLAILDGIDRPNRELIEYKTSEVEEMWNQRIADEHSQLSFYAYIYRLSHFSYFKEIRLYYLNTLKGNIKTYKTTRGPKDIEFIANRIETVVQEMKDVGIWEKRMSRKDRMEKMMTPLFT